MLSVILTILKILGISILVILGLLVALILLVMFVPIRYNASGDYKNKNIDLIGHITWLLHIVSVKILYNNDKPFQIKVCLFGIPLYDNLRKSDKKKKHKKIKTNNTKSDEENTRTEIQAASEPENDKEKTNIDGKEINSNKTIEYNQSDDIINEKEQSVESEEIEELCSDKGILDILSEKINNIITKIKYTFKKVYDTIFKIKNNIKYYIQLLQRERTKIAIRKLKSRLGVILKNLKPQKYKINLHLGFDNPELMGKIMAVNGILYPFHLGKIAVLPEFDQSIIEGNFEIKGRISIYVYVWTALIVLFDKDIKWLIKRLKRN